MSLQVAATPPKTVLVYTDFRLIQNTDVFGRLKWSWPERSGRNTHPYVVHTSSRHALNGAFTASSVWLMRAMLLPDAIPTIFPLSKKAVKAPAKKRGAFLKRERLGVSGHLVILPCITQFTSVQNDMFTPCSPFQCSRHENMPWFSTLKNIVSDFISLQDKHKHIKPFSLCLRLFRFV